MLLGLEAKCHAETPPSHHARRHISHNPPAAMAAQQKPPSRVRELPRNFSASVRKCNVGRCPSPILLCTAKKRAPKDWAKPTVHFHMLGQPPSRPPNTFERRIKPTMRQSSPFPPQHPKHSSETHPVSPPKNPFTPHNPWNNTHSSSCCFFTIGFFHAFNMDTLCEWTRCNSVFNILLQLQFYYCNTKGRRDWGVACASAEWRRSHGGGAAKTEPVAATHPQKNKNKSTHTHNSFPPHLNPGPAPYTPF